jgi:hypothetical protein
MFKPQSHSFTNGRASTVTATPLGPGGVQPIIGPGGIQQCPTKPASTLFADVFKCVESYSATSNVTQLDQIGVITGCMVKAVLNDHLVQTGVKAPTSTTSS